MKNFISLRANATCWHGYALASRQRGLALITAMLVVAIAATTAAFLSLDQQIWLRQAQNVADRAEAEAVRAAALEWAIIILNKDAQNNPASDDLTENWSKPLPALPAEGGQVTGRIVDAQGKFNLNNLFLFGTGKRSEADIKVFQNLLRSISADPHLADAVIDWIDANDTTEPYGAEDIDYLQLKTPYRAANQAMQSVEELRLVKGFTPEIVEKLRPWVTALEGRTDININTAPKEVLAALFSALPSIADQILAQRLSIPYKEITSISQLVAKLPNNDALPPYGVKSKYFEVTVDTLFGRYRRTTLALIRRGEGGGASRVLWHSQYLPIPAVVDTKTDEKSNTSADKNI